MANSTTDILIIGAGLSGIQLFNAIRKKKELNHKKILFIDDGSMKEKTWCFWEKGKGQWDHLVYKSWQRGSFTDQAGELNLRMKGYVYKMIRSKDFIKHFREKIREDERVEIIEDKVIEVDSQNLTLKTLKSEYSADFIFDSRFDHQEIANSSQPTVLQHFKGRFIKTDKDVFDPHQFTMMDFIPAKERECTFIYILPFSKNEALIEYTFFTPQLAEEAEYDRLLDQYIEDRFQDIEVVTTDSEFGIIPMSTYSFEKYNTSNYCRIGTAGGWVKASSGYSFKHAEKKSKLIADNLAKGNRVDKGLSQFRFKLYDRIFLSILQNENELGNRIFQEMYRKNSTDSIFRFLDEDSNPFEELRIVTSFNPTPFLRAVKREFL